MCTSFGNVNIVELRPQTQTACARRTYKNKNTTTRAGHIKQARPAHSEQPRDAIRAKDRIGSGLSKRVRPSICSPTGSRGMQSRVRAQRVAPIDSDRFGREGPFLIEPICSSLLTFESIFLLKESPAVEEGEAGWLEVGLLGFGCAPGDLVQAFTAPSVTPKALSVVWSAGSEKDFDIIDAFGARLPW